MTVDPKGMRSAADYMMKLSGVDPIWLREAADEIELLRFRLEYMENKYGKIAWDAVVPPANQS